MNRRIIALSLLVVPLVFYVLQYHDIVPAIYLTISLIAVLLVNLLILLPMNKKEKER